MFRAWAHLPVHIEGYFLSCYFINCGCLRHLLAAATHTHPGAVAQSIWSVNNHHTLSSCLPDTSHNTPGHIYVLWTHIVTGFPKLTKKSPEPRRNFPQRETSQTVGETSLAEKPSEPWEKLLSQRNLPNRGRNLPHRETSQTGGETCLAEKPPKP